MNMVPEGIHGEVDEDHTKYNPLVGPLTRPAAGQESSNKQSLQCDQCKFTTQLIKEIKATQRLKSHIKSQHIKFTFNFFGLYVGIKASNL